MGRWTYITGCSGCWCCQGAEGGQAHKGLFVRTLGVVKILKRMRGARERFCDPPGACKWVCELVDLALLGVGAHCASCKDNIANRVDSRIRSRRIDELPVDAVLFLNQEKGYLVTRSEAGGELLRVGRNSAGCQSELSIFAYGKIDAKSKFSTDSNKAA